MRLRPPTTRGTQMGTEKSHDSANKPAAESRPGWLTRQLGGVYAWRDAIKEHPLKGTGLAVAIFVLGRSEEHTSELQSLMRISYAVFCLKKQKTNKIRTLMN